MKAVRTEKTGTSRRKKAAAINANKSLPEGSAEVPTSRLPALDKGGAADVSPADATTGPKLFEAGIKAYRKDDCRAALELFDRYLAENSGSPLAADANLYKAECYLKLSAQ